MNVQKVGQGVFIPVSEKALMKYQELSARSTAILRGEEGAEKLTNQQLDFLAAANKIMHADGLFKDLLNRFVGRKNLLVSAYEKLIGKTVKVNNWQS